MPDEQIKQNAEAYADHKLDWSRKRHSESPYLAWKEGFEDGAHSRDEEIEELRKHDALENKMRIDLINECEQLKQELDQLRNPWISVEEQLPENNDLVLTIYWVHKDFYSIELSSYNPETCEWDCGEFGYRISHWMPIPELKGK